MSSAPRPPGEELPFERHRGELDISRDARPQRLRAAATALAAGCVVAALLGAAQLHDWAYQLQLDWGPALAPLVEATAWWRDAVAAIGASEAYEGLHRWLEALRQAGWP